MTVRELQNQIETNKRLDAILACLQRIEALLAEDWEIVEPR